jgi:hypothetical protein
MKINNKTGQYKNEVKIEVQKLKLIEKVSEIDIFDNNMFEKMSPIKLLYAN